MSSSIKIESFIGKILSSKNIAALCPQFLWSLDPKLKSWITPMRVGIRYRYEATRYLDDFSVDDFLIMDEFVSLLDPLWAMTLAAPHASNGVPASELPSSVTIICDICYHVLISTL